MKTEKLSDHVLRLSPIWLSAPRCYAMRCRIDSEGYLRTRTPRGGKAFWQLKDCPFAQASTSCGDWCPMFLTDNGELLLACARLVFWIERDGRMLPTWNPTLNEQEVTEKRRPVRQGGMP